MIKNYLLTAWRNLQKNKFNAAINIIGLSVAFTCCILLFLMVGNEFSYDSFQKNGSHLYQVYSSTQKSTGEDKGDSFGDPAAPAFKKEVAGVIASTGLQSAGGDIRYKGKELHQRITLVEPDFFRMFSFPVVAGARAPLTGVNDVVIAQATATALFGSEDPIGKGVEIKVGGEWKAVTVSAVLADAPDNSTIKYSILARPEIHPGYSRDKNNWDHQDHDVFVQLAPTALPAAAERDFRALVKKYKMVDEAQMRTQGYQKDANGDYMALKLERLADVHFDENLGGGNDAINKTYLYTLILIGVVVMVIACFNFVNLNVARSFTRAKEVGIRKTIGADRRQIYFQLWVESLLLFVLAVAIAVGAASSLLKPFNELFTEKLKLSALLQPGVLIIALAGAVFVSFLAGGYPAYLVSRFNTVEVLKGKVSVRRSSLLRNGLITLQFVLASALISSTLVIYRQFTHLRSASLGYTKESVISFPIKNNENSPRLADRLRMELGSQPWVAGVTASAINIGIGEDHSMSHSGWGFTYKGQGISTAVLEVDYDYLSVLGMKPIAGRDFSRDFPTDTATNTTNVVVTESMAKEFGFKDMKDAIGFNTSGDTTAPKWNIIGVIPDFHLYSMNEHMNPTTLVLNRHGGLSYVFVKVRTTNPRVTLGQVQTAFHKLEPDNTSQGSYLTENTERWYEKESRLSSIFFSSAAIAVLLSCLGLFAIVSLVMEQRRKEIGVRKVLGATILSMTRLLSRDFVRLVAIAFAISTPVAGYFLHRWLQNFEYRTEASWWIFGIAGALTLVIALLTVGVQTVRAALSNPVKSLRSE